jgi:ABC-type transport system substrate-binding protein
LHSDSIFPAGFNMSFYQNPEVDGLIDAGATESDPESSCDAYRRALNILWDDAPAVWLMTQPEPLALRDWVKGFTFNPSYTRQFDFYEVYKEDS